MALLTQPELEALLGRPLTTNEVTNLSTYLEIAGEQVSDLLCLPLEVQDETTVATERKFVKRQEFSTVFTPIFTELTSVSIDGTLDTNSYPSFWDNRNANFYNSVVLNTRHTSEDVEVTIVAKWGFASLPTDLKQLVARAFSVASATYQAKAVRSKEIEDFRITYADLTEDDVFSAKDDRTIRKYSLCGIADLMSTAVCEGGL